MERGAVQRREEKEQRKARGFPLLFLRGGGDSQGRLWPHNLDQVRFSWHVLVGFHIPLPTLAHDILLSSPSASLHPLNHLHNEVRSKFALFCIVFPVPHLVFGKERVFNTCLLNEWIDKRDAPKLHQQVYRSLQQPQKNTRAPVLCFPSIFSALSNTY